MRDIFKAAFLLGCVLIASSIWNCGGSSSANSNPPGGENQPPEVQLVLNAEEGKPPLDVDVHADASDPDGSIVEYKIDCDGDGSWDDSSNHPDFICHYDSPGDYTVVVLVKDNAGVSNSASAQIKVLPPNLPPSVSLSASPSSGLPPLSVQLSAQASDPDGSIALYKFKCNHDSQDFDLVSHDTSSFNCIYSQPGTYTAYVEVEDEDGATASDSVKITVVEANLQAPYITVFSANPQVGGAPLDSTITLAAVDADDDISGLYIDCEDDGVWDKSEVPGEYHANHIYSTTAICTYSSPGLYTVRGRVEDSAGNYDERTVQVSVVEAHAPTITGLTAVPPSGETPLLVSVTVNATDPDGDIQTYRLDCDGDGFYEKTSPSNTFTCTYTQPGTYTVNAEVEDSTSLSDTASTAVSARDFYWQRLNGGAAGEEGRAGFPVPSTSAETEYIVAGRVGNDFLALTTDVSGVMLNSSPAVFGGSDDDYLFGVCDYDADNYIVVGTTSSPEYVSGSLPDGYVAMLSKADNSVVWEVVVGGSGEETFYDCAKLPTGEIVVVGYSTSTDISAVQNHGGADGYVVVLDSQGKVKRQNLYGGTGYDFFAGVAVSPSRLIFVGGSKSPQVGASTNHGGMDVLLVTDAPLLSGGVAKLFGGSDDESASDVVYHDPYIYLCGTTGSNDFSTAEVCGSTVGFVMKLGNVELDEKWLATAGGNGLDGFRSLTLLDFGTTVAGIWAAGYTTSDNLPGYHGGRDVFLAEFSDSGVLMREVLYGGSDFDAAYSISFVKIPLGIYVVGVSSSPDIPGETLKGSSDVYQLMLKIDGSL